MKKLSILLICSLMFAGVAFTQAGAGLGPVRLKLGGKVGQTNEYSMTMNMTMMRSYYLLHYCL